MSRKRTVYTAALKTRLVLEVLKEEKTLVEIASTNKITSKDLHLAHVLNAKCKKEHKLSKRQDL